MKTGELNLSTELCSFLTLTAQSSEEHKAKLSALWPEYEARVLELQKVLYIPHETYGIVFNESTSDLQKRKAGCQLDAIRRELQHKVGWRDS